MTGGKRLGRDDKIPYTFGADIAVADMSRAEKGGALGLRLAVRKLSL
jgi:hypothetical protein